MSTPGQPPRKRARKAVSQPADHPVPPSRSRLKSGFTSVREALSYFLGAGVLIYGVTGASSDKALVVCGAGLALLGAPIVGSVFEKKD